MLPESKIYTFVSRDGQFNYYYLEGQKLINDLVILHSLNDSSIQMLRDFLLTFQPMIAFLKSSETLGIFIDSEDHAFNLKMETSFDSKTRALILKDQIFKPIQNISGICRLTKIATTQRPYTSVIKLHQNRLDEIINRLLKESYQIEAQILLSPESDQALLITKLPTLPGKVNTSLQEHIKNSTQKFQNLFQTPEVIKGDIISPLSNQLQAIFLGEKIINLACSCSKARMIQGLIALSKQEDIFEGKSDITTTCDYCHTDYTISKDELN